MITTPEQMREAAAQCCDQFDGPVSKSAFVNGQATAAQQIRAAIRAIPIAPQPVAVTVKPLVWFEVEKYRHGGKYTADGYTIRYIEGFFILDFAGNSKVAWRFPTIEAAKSAAQADYAARILSALTIQPADPLSDPRVVALVEAAKRLSSACDAMWNDCERLEENPHHFGQEYQIKDKHVRAISEAQQCLPAALRAIGGEA